MCTEHGQISYCDSHDEILHSHDTEQHICNHCGKSHSQYFIKEHHCLMETLSQTVINLQEQCSKNNFQTRDPPLSELFN